MEAPICLVQNWEEQLTVNPEAIRILEKISQPLVVVAIVGLYRTGKSYLMNRLAGQNHGECLSGDHFLGPVVGGRAHFSKLISRKSPVPLIDEISPFLSPNL